MSQLLQQRISPPFGSCPSTGDSGASPETSESQRKPVKATARATPAISNAARVIGPRDQNAETARADQRGDWRVLEVYGGLGKFYGDSQCGRSEMTRPPTEANLGRNQIKTRAGLVEPRSPKKHPKSGVQPSPGPWTMEGWVDRGGLVLDILVLPAGQPQKGPRKPRKGHAGLGKALKRFSNQVMPMLSANERIPMFYRVRRCTSRAGTLARFTH